MYNPKSYRKSLILLLLAVAPIMGCEKFVDWDKSLGQPTVDALAGEWAIERMTFYARNGDSLAIPFQRGTFGFVWYEVKKSSPENGEGWFMLDTKRTRFRYGPLSRTDDQIFINVNQAASIMFSASCRIQVSDAGKLTINDLSTSYGPNLESQAQGRSRIELVRK